MTKYLDEAEVLKLHYALVDVFRDSDPIKPPGPRNSSLLGSACGRPQTALGGTEKYPQIEEKAAAFFHSLVKNHPFHNGNKRTALVATIVFLDQNKRHLKPDVADDDIFDLVTNVAANTFPAKTHKLDDDRVVVEIAGWIGRNTKPRNPHPTGMRTSDFLEKCELAGGSYRDAKNGWLVRGPNGTSIKLAGSTKKLDGGAIKTYVLKLGLAGPSAGVYIDEFQAGIEPQQAVLLRLRSVLRRLANV